MTDLPIVFGGAMVDSAQLYTRNEERLGTVDASSRLTIDMKWKGRFVGCLSTGVIFGGVEDEIKE
jgi:hypothetical protein